MVQGETDGKVFNKLQYKISPNIFIPFVFQDIFRLEEPCPKPASEKVSKAPFDISKQLMKYYIFFKKNITATAS